MTGRAEGARGRALRSRGVPRECTARMTRGACRVRSSQSGGLVKGGLAMYVLLLCYYC